MQHQLLADNNCCSTKELIGHVQIALAVPHSFFHSPLVIYTFQDTQHIGPNTLPCIALIFYNRFSQVREGSRSPYTEVSPLFSQQGLHLCHQNLASPWRRGLLSGHTQYVPSSEYILECFVKLHRR